MRGGMMHKFDVRTLVLAVVVGGLVLGIAGAVAQQPAGEGKQAQAKAKQPPRPRPPLFFREDWKQPATTGERPPTQEDLTNQNVELKLYGPSGKDIQLSGNVLTDTNPLNLWTGLTTSPIAVAFREKNNFVDLTGLARVHWVTRSSGFHLMRPAVKLADGTWLVGDRTPSPSEDFNESELSYAEVRWTKLDIERVVTKGRAVDNVDLSKVDEVGFADLLPGSGHGPGGFVNLGKIEVYGTPVKR